MNAVVDNGFWQKIKGIARIARPGVSDTHVLQFREHLHQSLTQMTKFAFRIVRAGAGTATEDDTGTIRRGPVIVVDIAPVGYDNENERYINAMEMVDLAALQNRKDADAQLTRHVNDASLRGFFLLNLSHSGNRFTWRINLKGLKAGLMTLHGFPDVLKEMIFEGQVMFLGGEKSDYIRAAYEPAIRGYFPNAQIVKIKGAAHWLHADKPDEFIKVVRNFLS